MTEVVSLHYETEQIARVILDDKETGNCFSPQITEGLIKTFQLIKENNRIKAVIVHGGGNYFCCGGTKGQLTDLSEGKGTFNDTSFYRCLIDCEVPTIAAMQGHAIGGGLTFGLYADFIVMGEECLYAANFMRYGFTPGVGATYLIPEKLGRLLGTEMLFTARNFQGRELKERGADVAIVKKSEVLNYALALAKELADKPLVSLKALKAHLVKPLKEKIESMIEGEIAMHEITFRTPEVKERIKLLFGK